jgi:hypothetical protein
MEHLGPVDQLFLMPPVRFTKHPTYHFVEHRKRGIGHLDFQLSGEDHQGGKPPLVIEAVQVLGAEDCGLAGNGRVARPMNSLFSIRPDAERPEQLKPFDNRGEVLLNGRLCGGFSLGPSTRPGNRR